MRGWGWVVVAAGLMMGAVGCGRRAGAGRVVAEVRGGAGAQGAAFAGAMPRVVLWAWEEPEDLRAVDVARVGVAYLAETVWVGERVRVTPRHQPMRLAEGTRLMAVVRVEAERGFRDTPEERMALVRELGLVAARPGLRAMQVDFDAVASQHEFYAGVLRGLAREIPPGMPLSVTALVSWCGEGGWLRGLPVAEAVPMFFRMGGPGAHGAGIATPLGGGRVSAGNGVDAGMAGAERGLRAPCVGSLGVSVDERWPPVPAGVRVYLFSPRPWTADELGKVNRLDLPMLAATSAAVVGSGSQ